MDKIKCYGKIRSLYIKQHLSNIWGIIPYKAKQHWGLVEKRRCLLKKRVIVFEKQK